MLISIIITIQADSVVSDTNRFIPFCLQILATRRERHNSWKPMLSILLCTPSLKKKTTKKRAANLVMSNISTHLCRWRPKLIWSDQILKPQQPVWRSNLLNPPIFLKSKILETYSSGHDVIHLLSSLEEGVEPHGSLLWQMRIFISFPRGHSSVLSD